MADRAQLLAELRRALADADAEELRELRIRGGFPAHVAASAVRERVSINTMTVDASYFRTRGLAAAAFLLARHLGDAEILSLLEGRTQ
jgi:hypothetical protein